jgi:outer membrane protein insertion porin family
LKPLSARFLLLFLTCFSLLPSLHLHGQNMLGKDQEAFDYTKPQEYEIGGIMVTGAQYLDEAAVVNISGLTVGEKIMIPGDKVSKAIDKLWKQGIFSDIKITSSKTLSNQPMGQADVIFLNIVAKEKPRLSRFSFKGVGKSEADDLKEKISLVKGKPVTDNLKTNTYNITRNYFIDKGFLNVKVNIKEEADSSLPNSVTLTIQIDKQQKIKINRIYIHGNTELPAGRLRRSLGDTKERNRVDLFHDIYTTVTDSIETINIKHILGALGNPKKLYEYATPRLRLAFFSTSKFIDHTYQTDKQSIVSKYADAGYRDARIAKDSVYRFDEKSINIDITLDEGNKYYFRNISWVGNTKHTSEELSNLLSIKKGAIFNQASLDARLFMNPDGRDVSSLYLDDGYLFFSVTPVEINVEKDSIDLEMRIYEGKQATINKVYITGNTKTNDTLPISKDAPTMWGAVRLRPLRPHP